MTKKSIHHNIKDMKTFNVIEYLKKEPFDIDEFLVMIGRAELLSREEEKDLVIKARQGDDEAMNQFCGQMLVSLPVWCANTKIKKPAYRNSSMWVCLHCGMP